MTSPLPASFYSRDTIIVARELIGTLLVHEPEDGVRRVGRVVETEAYKQDDPACHAFTTAKVPNPLRRSAFLFGKPGLAYVYFNYGVHWMLNAVCEEEGTAGAVLIRAVEPLEGIDEMKRRRGVESIVELANGPGKLTQAFGIDGNHHGLWLTKGSLHFLPRKKKDVPKVISTTRIGITKGVEHPWRFIEAGSKFVSRGKPSGLSLGKTK
jgi:DNA-3-methyladenine glycosylase